MVNYKNGKIYCIRSHKTDKIYIGSTTQILCKRMTGHKRKLQNCTSKIIMSYGDAYIELIEEYPCKNKMELNKKEGEYIRKFKDICVNRCIAGRTPTEYIKEYYKKNKELIDKKNKIWRENNKDKKRESDRKWREKNKQRKSETERKRRLKNRIKIPCVCGSSIFKYKLNDHKKTKKHKKFMTNYLDDIFDNFNNNPIF